MLLLLLVKELKKLSASVANIFRMSTSRRKYFHGKKLNETKRKRNDLGSSVSVSSQFKKGLLFVVHFYSELLSWHQDAKERGERDDLT